MTPEQRDVLILRYLDHTASADDVAKLSELLQADGEARQSLRDLAEQAAMMADLARERTIHSADPDRRRPVRLRPGRARRRWLWGLAAACIGLVVAGTFIWVGGRGRPNITIAQFSGAVSYTPHGGEIQTVFQVGERVTEGTFRVEGTAGSLWLSFDDGTSVMLAGDAELVLVSAGTQKLLTLNEGSLAADVRPQAPERPMRIRTPTADLEVVGTQFMVTAEKAQTKLAVESGTVKFQRRDDGNRIDVTQGREAAANLGAEKMESRLQDRRDTFRKTFEKEPEAAESWRGKWAGPDAATPGRLRSVEDISYRRADGTPVAAYMVSVHHRPESIVTVTGESVLCLRLRTAAPRPVLVLLGLRLPTEGYLGNYQTMIEPGDGETDETGWRTIRRPLSSLKMVWTGLKNPPAAIPPDSRVSLIFLAAYDRKANLEVAEVSITPPDGTKQAP